MIGVYVLHLLWVPVGHAPLDDFAVSIRVYVLYCLF